MIGMHTCRRCVHFSEAEGVEFGKCSAYPEGIPYEVYAFMRHWDKPENCRNGFGFEPKKKSEGGEPNAPD